MAEPSSDPAISAAPPRRQTPRGINWFRFWMQMLVAMLVFNLIAGLVTWFFIFPHLHPPK
jgi:heme/copper-type cytochrome/quinol oxidase subunit 2